MHLVNLLNALAAHFRQPLRSHSVAQSSTGGDGCVVALPMVDHYTGGAVVVVVGSEAELAAADVDGTVVVVVAAVDGVHLVGPQLALLSLHLIGS